MIKLLYPETCMKKTVFFVVFPPPLFFLKFHLFDFPNSFMHFTTQPFTLWWLSQLHSFKSPLVIQILLRVSSVMVTEMLQIIITSQKTCLSHQGMQCA